MEKLHFLVKGSAEEPYEVTFIKRSSTNLSAYCTCPAGQNRLYCKHRFRIIDGENKNLVSGNDSDISIVQSWLLGTDVEATLIDVRRLDNDFEKAKKALSIAKKALAKAMWD